MAELGITLTTGLQGKPVFADPKQEIMNVEVVVSSPAHLYPGTVLEGTAAAGIIWSNSNDTIGVLLEEVDASAGDVTSVMACGGSFNQMALIATTTPVALGVLPGHKLIHVVKEF